ncbi:hypothetical protein IMG5_055830 [Ichthyophthirius multifiliis]|uniref:Uncharacterized protein n=1 Tax=Ichthyophthirius multifiliis TaxID=5932 RepID=G0QN66_ICHMU|nr:hypothetical protein IMG5_055830 [Ichthyophthirius multifiliis]EGR33338.1 hypothetical protein IMG5_055830 [Ichthyophthirius multifiliis]|eukprot:XP_004037324.1 hypothetical protein IMG5_055830 [Ichthyophthirius multifiliis]
MKKCVVHFLQNPKNFNNLNQNQTKQQINLPNQVHILNYFQSQQNQRLSKTQYNYQYTQTQIQQQTQQAYCMNQQLQKFKKKNMEKILKIFMKSQQNKTYQVIQ